METKFKEFVRNYWIIFIIIIAFIVIAWILIYYNVLDTGLNTNKTVSIETQKSHNVKITEIYTAKKTVWDLIQLFLIPFVLISVSIIFNNIQKKREQEIAAQIEYENVFQNYLKNLSELLLHHNLLTSNEGDVARALASTRTKTTLRVLDGSRRGRVIRFLYDTGLIQIEKNIISTDILEFYGAHMINFRFKNATLKNARLDRSDFRGAVMDNVDLTNTTLKNAMLRNADFTTAILTGANLEGAIYDGRTKWPEDFKIEEHKMIYDPKKKIKI